MYRNPNQQQRDMEEELVDIVEQLNDDHKHHQVHRYKSFIYLLTIVATISLSSFFYGYSMVYLPSMEFHSIYQMYNISISYAVAQGVLVACIPFGGGLGAMSSFLLIQRFSRRQSLLIANVFAISSILLLGIKSFPIFVLARLFQGYCTGLLSSIAPLMMKEISPLQISGTLTTCHHIFMTSGATFGFVFSLILNYITDDPLFKWTVLYGCLLIVLGVQTFLLLTTFRYETPKYLLLAGKEDQAKELIQKIYKPEFVEEVLKEMKDNLRHHSGTATDDEQKQDIEMVQTKGGVFPHDKQQTKVKHRQTPRSAAIAAIHLASLQKLCGVNALIAYGGLIVGQLQPKLKLVMPIIVNIILLVFGLMASYLLLRVGRKLLLEMGALTTAIGSVLAGIGFMTGSLGWILFGMIFFMACFGVTLGPVVWIYLPEVAQPRILSLATAANWVSCSLVMLLFPIIKKILPGQNPAPILFAFAGYSFFSYLINVKYIIETRNKGEKQIHSEYIKMQSFL